jgi:hypothetical protein
LEKEMEVRRKPVGSLPRGNSPMRQIGLMPPLRGRDRQTDRQIRGFA